MLPIFKELECRANRLLGVAVAGVILLAGAEVARAQETDSDWEFYTSPYIWMAGFGIDTRAVGPVPSTSVKIDFSEVLENLNIALENTFEARKGRFVALVDFNYFSLSADEGLSGPVFTKADMDMESILSVAAVGFQLVDHDPIAFDVLAGAQVVWMDVDASIKGPGSVSASDSDTLIDPIIGFQSKINLGSGIFLSSAGMIGGFGVESKLTWQLFGGVGWQANDWLALRAGYRHWQLETEGNGLIETVTMTGPIIGATFRF